MNDETKIFIKDAVEVAVQESNKFNTADVLTLFAIVIGPMIGIILAYCLEHMREKKKRRLDIYATLMRTRSLGLSVDHVAALNLIKVEFHDNKAVLSVWKEYLDDLSLPSLQADTDPVVANQHAENRRKKLAKLISEIAKCVGIKVSELDAFEHSYAPQGWFKDEDEQRYLRRLLLNLFRKGHVPVQIKEPTPDAFDPYPTRPDNNE